MSSINTITNPQNKCGEIFYQENQNQRWCYLCVFCGETTQNHDEFQKHFQQHLEEEVKDDPLQETGDTKEEQFDNYEEKKCLEDLSTDNEMERKEESKFSNLEIFDGNSTKKGNIWHNDSENSLKIDSDLSPSKDSKINLKRPYKPRNKAFFCTYCKRTFRRRYQYNTHLNIHTGAKPHQCEICGRQFRAVTTLQRHLSTHKQQNFIFHCKYCNKSFTHKVALVSHEIRHTQKRDEHCDLCEKSFYTSNQLDTHKRRVHNKSNDILPFGCDLCSNRYRSSSMLSTHKLKKHLRTAKYQCEKCEKKFIDLPKLDEHKSIHFDGKISAEYINLVKTSNI